MFSKFSNTKILENILDRPEYKFVARPKDIGYSKRR